MVTAARGVSRRVGAESSAGARRRSTVLEGSGGARTSLEIDEEEAPPSLQWWSGCGNGTPVLHFGLPSRPNESGHFDPAFEWVDPARNFHFVSLFWVVGGGVGPHKPASRLMRTLSQVLLDC
jgi:hypothetical protein